MEELWRRCIRCRELTFPGFGAPGACPGGWEHVHGDSDDYVVEADPEGVASGAQSGWLRCRSCLALAYAGGGSPGVCLSGVHDFRDSPLYRLFPAGSEGAPPGPGGWMWCSKCQTVALTGEASAGACAAGGEHDRSAGGTYVLRRQPAAALPAEALALVSAPDFLLVRPDDLVVLGVRWSGFDVRAADAGPTHIVARDPRATVTIVFGPQSLAEEKYATEGDVSPRDARLSGLSRVAFRVPPGTEVALDVTGVLEALAADGTFVLESGEGLPTAIELPWGLTISPHARSGDAVSDHASLPLVSATSGVVGLWHASLRSSEGSPSDVGLEVMALAADPSDGGLPEARPLEGGQRQSIVDAIDNARAGRLELSALGGSLSARLDSGGFAWDHDIVLGRDQRVRVAEEGVLYPFGHRAVYIEFAERTFGPGGSPTVAGMHRTTLLLVTQPVRPTDDGGTRLRRQFPFSEVEILNRSIPGIQPAAYEVYRRQPVPHGELQEELDGLVPQLQQLEADVLAALANLPPTLQAYIDEGRGSSLALQEAASAAGFDPEGMRAAQRSIDSQIDALERQLEPTTGPDGEPVPVDEGTWQAVRSEIERLISERPSNQAIQDAIAGAAAAQADVVRFSAAVQQEFNALPRTIEAAAAGGDGQAVQVLDLRSRRDALQRLIAGIGAVADAPHNLFFVPRGADGEAVRFALRCVGTVGDLSLSLPLIFVKDVSFAEEPFFDAFHSLTDEGVAGRLATAWAANAAVPIPGVRVDVVRAGGPVPAPGDVHEVQALTLVATSHDGGFRPQLTQLQVELPALRSLLPDAGGLHTLRFAEAFLDEPGIPEVPLTLDASIDVDFTQVAARSGGLVSPKFLVDGVSRTLGPVAAGALPPELAGALPDGVPAFDLASIYAGATLLGFPLASLIKLPANPLEAAADLLPRPPAIVQLFEGGMPNGMKMEWSLDLDEHGPFRPGPDTKLVLTVECSLTTRQTVCTVNDFALVLPPAGDENLLRLTFKALRFTQRQGKAPDLDIVGMGVEFGGALKLFQELEAALSDFIDLPDNRPKVDVTPTGLTASYGIAVPTVTAGAFTLANVAVHVGVDVPFDGKPVTVGLSFATRHDPFGVGVLMFSGGGYIDLLLGPAGLLRLEASISFGASVEVDFVVARGEVHALGGVRFVQGGGGIEIDGFLSIGGSVEVLGLVSISINLLVTLSYRDGNRLVGRATIVVEIDLTLYSDSVEIDSGEWVLAGSSSRQGLLPAGPDGLEAMVATYRSAFEAA